MSVIRSELPLPHRLRLGAKTRRRPQDPLSPEQREQATPKLLGVLPAAREPAREAGVGEHSIHPQTHRALASGAIPIEEGIDNDAPLVSDGLCESLRKGR